jgi:hypothetical protein
MLQPAGRRGYGYCILQSGAAPLGLDLVFQLTQRFRAGLISRLRRRSVAETKYSKI